MDTPQQLSERGSISKPDPMLNPICNEGLFVNGSPVLPTSSEFLRPRDQSFRKEEPYQPRPAMLSTFGEDVGGKQKLGEGGIRAPQSEVSRCLVIRHFPKETRQACSFVLPVSS